MKSMNSKLMMVAMSLAAGMLGSMSACAPSAVADAPEVERERAQVYKRPTARKGRRYPSDVAPIALHVRHGNPLTGVHSQTRESVRRRAQKLLSTVAAERADALGDVS